MNRGAALRLTATMIFVCINFNTGGYTNEQVNNFNALENIKINVMFQNKTEIRDKDLDISEVNTDNTVPESIKEESNKNANANEGNSVKNTPEDPIEPQESKPDTSKTEKVVQAKRILIDSINVINARESSYVNIKQSPSSKSRTIGIVYGDLTAIKVIKKSGSYTYIEAMDYKTDKLVRGYVLSSQIKTRIPKKQFQVIIDISDQRVYVYNYDKLERVMTCSTGMKGSTTPLGTYLIGKRGSSFFSDKYKQGGYNWVRFNYNFLFHSVPFDEKRVLIPREAQKLGQPASHGCVRLSMEDSKWFYQKIPEGTLVVVQQ